MKISDFKFAEFFIRGICTTHSCPFIDLPIRFDPDKDSPFFDKGNIVIGKSNKWNKTIFQIVAVYLQNLNTITESNVDLTREERNLIINNTVAILRDFTYSTHIFPEAILAESVVIELNRSPFVWTVMSSIICPAFDKPIKNIRIIARKSPYMDGAKFLNAGDVPAKDDSIFPFVFSNLEIENSASRNAFLLYEVIRAHEMDPRGIMHEVLSKQELWNKFYGLIKIAFQDTNAINDFVTTMSIIAGEMGNIDKRLMQEKTSKWNRKVGLWSQGQYSGGGNGSWWYLGLMEKLLEPARGADWSGYFTMKPFTDELWEKVENEKKRRGMSQLPLELLLRVQSDEFKSQPDLIIQGLLADNRVW